MKIGSVAKKVGFIIKDLSNKDNDLYCDFWNWHPTVEIIRSFGIIEHDRIELMHISTVGAEVTNEEAEEISTRLIKMIETLPPEARAKLDLSITTEPDDHKMHTGEDADQNYSATISWLRKFSNFCKSCDGFKIA